MGSFFKGVGSALGLTGGSEVGGYNKALGLYGADKPVTAPSLQRLAFENLGPSAFGGLNQDPNSIAAQDTALSELTGLATQQGLSPSDLAKLNQISERQKITEQGQRGALEASARSRGLMGSGLSLASKLLGGQTASNQATSAGTDVLAGADARRAAAIGALGNLGTNVGGQRFEMGARKATAADEIARYNNEIRNRARAYNVTQLPQQNFENRMRLAGEKAGLLTKRGSAQQDQDKRSGDFLGNVVGGVAGFLSDERKKTNIKPANMKDFLDKISASSYEYKDERFGKGKHAGPMAQELESTEFGKSAVMETPIGKMVHSGKLAALALASSKSLHDRLKKLEKN